MALFPPREVMAGGDTPLPDCLNACGSVDNPIAQDLASP